MTRAALRRSQDDDHDGLVALPPIEDVRNRLRSSVKSFQASYPGRRAAALAAVCLGLGSCQIGAFYDDEADELLGVNAAEETTVYMTAVGRPAR